MNKPYSDAHVIAEPMTSDIKASLLSLLSKVAHNLKFDVQKAMNTDGLMIADDKLHLIKQPDSLNPLTVECTNCWPLCLIELDSQRGNIAKRRLGTFADVDNNELLTGEGKNEISHMLEGLPVEVNFDFIKKTLASHQAILIFNGDIHIIDETPNVEMARRTSGDSTDQEKQSIEFEAMRNASLSQRLGLWL
jgi:hypothetical protein